MKVVFVCDSGANIHSAREEVFDTVEDLGMEEGEWEAMDAKEQFDAIMEWAWDYMEIYWKEVN